MIESPIKYAGGKRAISREVVDLLRRGRPEAYIEPFLGSGAVLLRMAAEAPWIHRLEAGDLSPFTSLWWSSLAHTDAAEVLRVLHDRDDELPSVLPDDPDQVYLPQRAWLNSVLADGRALDRPGVVVAKLWWINHACFNGLVRFNQSGEYNVAAAAPRQKVGFPDARQLDHACAVARRSWGGRRAAVETLREYRGDPKRAVVYLDPPYLDTFDGYTGRGWVDDDLLDLILAAAPFGRVVLSEHDSDRVRDFLGPEWRVVHRWGRSGSINCDVSKRQKVAEAVYLREAT